LHRLVVARALGSAHLVQPFPGHPNKEPRLGAHDLQHPRGLLLDRGLSRVQLAVRVVSQARCDLVKPGVQVIPHRGRGPRGGEADLLSDLHEPALVPLAGGHGVDDLVQQRAQHVRRIVQQRRDEDVRHAILRRTGVPALTDDTLLAAETPARGEAHADVDRRDLVALLLHDGCQRRHGLGQPVLSIRAHSSSFSRYSLTCLNRRCYLRAAQDRRSARFTTATAPPSWVRTTFSSVTWIEARAALSRWSPTT